MNLMLSKTKEYLEKKLIKAREDLADSLVKQGEACSDNCDWHDNGAYDCAMEDTRRNQATVRDLELALKKVEIIKPNKDTSKARIGHTLKLKIKDKVLTYQLLGDYDSGVIKNCISIKSVVGSKLVGKPVGIIEEGLKILEIK